MRRPAPIALLAALAVLPAAGQEPQPGRLSRLETEVRDLRRVVDALTEERQSQKRRIVDLEERLADALAEDVDAEIETLVARAAADLAPALGRQAEPSLVWGGYFDVEFRHDNAGDRPIEFDQHRLILKLRSDVTDWIAFEMELEIEGGGADVGFLTGNQVVVEFAEVSFRIDEAFQPKFGALLVPFNRFNLLHDSPLQDLTDRPLVARRIVPTTWTEAGAGAMGAVHPADWISFDYDVALVNGLTDDMSASGGTRSARGSFRSDNNDGKLLVGRLGATIDAPFLDALVLGFSAAHGTYDDAGRRELTMIGIDWTLRRGPFELVGEYACLDLSRGPDEVAAGIPPGMEGWYVELRYHFFPDSWRDLEPFFGEGSTFTLVARYGEADTDTSGTAVDFASRGDRYRDDRRRLTVGINFRPVERTVLKVEYQWFFEPSGIPDVDNNRFVASLATYF